MKPTQIFLHFTLLLTHCVSRSKRGQTTADINVIKGVTWLKSAPLALLVSAMNWNLCFHSWHCNYKRIWCKNNYEWTQETLTLSWRVTGNRFAWSQCCLSIARQRHSPLPVMENQLCSPTKHTYSAQTLYRGFHSWTHSGTGVSALGWQQLLPITQPIEGAQLQLGFSVHSLIKATRGAMEWKRLKTKQNQELTTISSHTHIKKKKKEHVQEWRIPLLVLSRLFSWDFHQEHYQGFMLMYTGSTYFDLPLH